MRNAIPYRGEWLCKGSEAYELHEAMTKATSPEDRKTTSAKFKQHMATIDQQFRALHGLPCVSTTPRERGP